MSDSIDTVLQIRTGGGVVETMPPGATLESAIARANRYAARDVDMNNKYGAAWPKRRAFEVWRVESTRLAVSKESASHEES